MNVLHIRQDKPVDDSYPIRLTLRRDGQPDLQAEAAIEFEVTDEEQEDLRWYLEDYLQRATDVEAVTVQQVETLMKLRGEELYTKVLAANPRTQAIWFAIRNDLADLRIEIASGVVEAASIPWELMRDPEMDSPISLRVKSFVRVQSDPNISFVPVPQAQDGRIRLLYIACRPGGANDVELRAVANRLLHDLGEDRARFDIKALRPPTFEQLQKELTDAKEAHHPYHIVHFDGHGVYADLSKSKLADWIGTLSSVTLGGEKSGKHGYLLFEHSSEDKTRPVDGQTLGQLLHDNRVPVLVLNACQSAMHEASVAPGISESVHDEVRAIGSLAQAVVDQGIPAVLGMRYSVYVVTAAQYIGQLYSALAKGRGFGQAATEGRKHLRHNPERWVGLQPRPLQDWFVPVVYEAGHTELLPTANIPTLTGTPELDPIQRNRALLRYVPEEGFIGRDETILALDRAFDSHRVVLLYAYAGQGKSSTAVEFARWYSVTGGLGEQPVVLLASFESHTDLDDLLNQIGQVFGPVLEAQGYNWSAINEPERRRELVIRILRAFPVLWIWDNVEPVAGFPEGTESQWSADEQKDVRDFLQQLKLDGTSKVKVLITSRRDEKKWLGGIPHRIRMRRMRNSDAARLALKLGEERNIKRSEISDWQPLLDYCAGNPLTLRVLVGQAARMEVRGRQQIGDFVEAIRSGEQQIEDIDEEQGRDKSLGASLDYGFRNAFKEDELPIIALLHLFQGTVDVDAFKLLGVGNYALPELKGKDADYLTGLLERAKEIGLLTHIHGTWFSIHPALPWFLRQLFARYYDGQSGRPTVHSAVRSWVAAIASLSDYYFQLFVNGNRRVINLLEMEESNLLHARRLARRNQLWNFVIFCMQGLRVLYEVHGRTAEWAGLVEEIRSDYCTAENEPVPGREGAYTVVMDYRVRLARDFELDLSKGAALQEKCVEWDKKLAHTALVVPEGFPLDEEQHEQLRNLATSLVTLGQILRVAGSTECVQRFLEAIRMFRRMDEKAFEAVGEYNLGHAYLDVDSIRDLDSAEAAFQRSLNLRGTTDDIGRARCIQNLGLVYYERFREARKQKKPIETLQSHAEAAERHYLEAFRLYPSDSFGELTTLNNQLGNLYSDIGQLDAARKQYEKGVQYYEQTGDHRNAGRTRYNMAVMYAQAASQEEDESQRQTYFVRALAYAQAALRDFQHYEGRAAEHEANAQRLIDHIKADLAKLP